MRGRFITFEGGEGTGKSTHSTLLADRLKSGDHVRNTIEPALAQGVWVVCDRFLDSTRVYQGSLGHLDPLFIRALERVTIGDLKPDLTFVLDVPAEIGLARASKRRGERVADRFEAESRAFHEALREAYREIVAAEPGRCIAIDATEPKAAVAERIWKTVTERFDSTRVSSLPAGAAS